MKKVLIVGNRDAGRNANYYNAVEACGASAVPADFPAKANSVRGVDGIIIPGGADLNPALYGEENVASREIDDALDDAEMRIIADAVKGGVPILGICRGLQILNVFFGGTLVQHLATAERHVRIQERDNVHGTSVSEGSFLHGIYGGTSVSVNSAHHQAVKKLGGGLRAVQHCDDGTIEAVVHESLPVIAVQWHPERMCLANARPDTVDGLPVFRYFLDELCRGGA